MKINEQTFGEAHNYKMYSTCQARRNEILNGGLIERLFKRYK